MYPCPPFVNSSRMYSASGVGCWALSLDMVQLPETQDKLRYVVGLYMRIGLPGCVGSVDCVHLVYDKYPSGYLSQCKFKEKHTTLTFQVVVFHTKRILALSQIFAGATNNKSISQCNVTIQKARAKSKWIGVLMIRMGLRGDRRGVFHL